MAGASSDTFSCPICWDVLNCPVTIVCGHSYCMDCINQVWDEEAQTLGAQAIYSCPGCRQTFTPRPVVSRNIVLAEVIQMLNPPGVKDAPHPSTQSRNLKCFDCAGNEQNATVSCLACRVALCESHHALHETQHSRQNHREQISMKITDKEHDLQTLVKDVKYMKGSVQATIEHTERVFAELICSIGKIPSELTQLVRAKERTELDHAEGVTEQLIEEISCLRRRAAEMEQSSWAENDCYGSLPPGVPSRSEINQPVTHKPNISFRDVRTIVSQMKEDILDFCNDEVEKIAAKLTSIQIIPQENITRQNILKYFHPLTLDINTAHFNLRVTKENMHVENINCTLQYPEHPDRFDCVYQVLCNEAVTGRSYWEVQWSGQNGVIVAVSYKSITRKSDGQESLFGYNDQSWRLRCTPFGCSFKHNNREVQFPPLPTVKVGVYVDHKAGTLCFYQVSDTITLIHKVQTTFTKPLFPGIGVHPGSLVKICKLGV